MPYTTDLIIWHKAESLTDLGTNDGQAIYQWPDSSGNNYHSYSANVNQRPIYRSNIVNGYPAIQFDAPSAQHVMMISNVLQPLQPQKAELFLVLCSDVSVAATNRGLYRLTGATGNVGYYPDTSGNIRETFGGFQVSGKTPPSSITSWHIYHVYAETNSGTEKWKGTNWINNAVVGGVTNYYAAPWSTIHNLGSGSSTLAANFFDGYMAELIIYTNSLDDTARTDVMNYLSEKYNISL